MCTIEIHTYLQSDWYTHSFGFLVLLEGYFRIRLCAEGAATTAAEAPDPSAGASGHAHPVFVEVLRGG